MPSSNAGLSPTEEGDEKHLVQDVVVPDMPPFNRFSINVPSEPSRPISTPTSSDRPALSSDSGGSDSSDDEDSGHEAEAGDTFDANHSPTIPRIRPVLSGQPALAHPRFSRAFSLPLPSQLGHLEHPHKSSLSSPRQTAYSDPVSPQPQFAELSLELADSVQMVIQTLLQISPAQVLDPAKEQFSACALAVPTPSMSAMFTAMKNLNYISANMSAFASEEDVEDVPLFSSRKHNDFDIGELLQNTGDALSGSAAQAGVDLVLFHGDATLKHVSVKGDESGMSYLLAHLIRQVLATCQRGDTIELGLFVKSRSSLLRQNSLPPETPEEDLYRAMEGEGKVQCVVEIIHRFSPASTSEGTSRRQPLFSALLSRRLLDKVGATLSEPVPSFDGSLEIGRSCRLSFALDAGVSPHESPGTTMEDGSSASEPSLEQLSTFVDSLKGKKVHLYASSKGSFAHHLTSYLTTWGMDVRHISKEGGVESIPENPSPSPTTALSSSNINYTPSGIPPKMEPPRQPKTQPVSFIFIDDDTTVLKERLQAIREEQMYPLNIGRKRPSLAAHHRPRSSPQVNRISPAVNASTPTPVVILHFTSLGNYKATKDLVQSVLSSYTGTLSPLPEVMIIPKPAGPRRFLTALHTAVTKPVVDRFFSPIATTPSTPYTLTGTSFFGSYSNPSSNSPRTPSVHRPSGSRSSSNGSSRSVNTITENHANIPPSPLGTQESTEYFSSEGVAKFGEAAVKLGDTARAGVILQSPDGYSTGIFFSPRAEKTSPFSSYSTERERGRLSSVVSGPRRSISSVEAPQVTFSSLREEVSGESPRSGTRPGTRPGGIGIDVNVKAPSRRSPETPPQTPGRSSLDLGVRKGISTVTPPGSPLAGSSVPPIARPPRRPKEAKGLGLIPALTGKKGKSPAENIVPPISVLIVDDNPINRTILSTFMKKNKIKYDVASNGKEAVEKWKTGEFHLILMDIQMPVMDGIDATRTIRHIERVNAGYIQPSPSVESEDRFSSTASDETDSRASAPSPYRSSVIIVALTASSLQSDRLAALGAGCNDFLTKPVSLQWLNNKLIEWGSIKALSMYADMTPDAVKTQKTQAKNIAERLHVPRGRKTPPSPTVPKPPAPSVQPATPPPSAVSQPPQSASPPSGSSSLWSPGQPSAALSFRTHLGLKSPLSDTPIDHHGFRDPQDDSTPPLPSSVVLDPPSSTQTPTQSPPTSEDINGFFSNRERFDPNSSTNTLKQGDIIRSKNPEETQTQTNASSDSVRESGSTSSISRSPSPSTPATPGSPVPSATLEENEKENSKLCDTDPVDVRLEEVPGGCMEIYAQGGDAQGDPLVVTP